MITDVFHKRYPHVGYSSGGVSREIHVFFRQAAQTLFVDLKPHFRNFEDVCQKAYHKLVRELGYGLYDGRNAEDNCFGALCETYDLWNNAHGSPGQFVSYRLSLLELLFLQIENKLEILAGLKQEEKSGFFSRGGQDKANSEKKKAFREAIGELNHRLRESRLPFHYHNGIFQFGNDEIVEKEVYEPFWSIVKDPKFRNVDIDIKEALDRHDTNGRDAAFYALKALESTIKIISDDKGWTRGTERGAANYVDNLVSSGNGRFVDVWEADLLKKLFSELRNPHGHGPGSSPQPALTKQQELWVIESSIIWIKSLINRK
jgi:hypothetical protein